MSQKQENFRKVSRMLSERRDAARSTAEAHLTDLHARSARAAEIDRELAGTAMKIFAAASSGERIEEKVAAIREESEALRAERAAILDALGLPRDYTDPHYTCKTCSDTGYVMTEMCSCMKDLLRQENLRTCGAAAGMATQSFDTFSLRYYRDDPEEYALMAQTLRIAQNFAEHFVPGEESLLLMGGTGLGKTHLSTAIARAVVEGGHDVIYETVSQVFEDFEYDRFRSDKGTEEKRAEKYLTCDLLILDDLGTEFTNSFTVACLYQLVNTRLIRGLSTVISTNLTPAELTNRYDERLTSRFLGAYRVLRFVGRDIRFQKLADPDRP